MSALPDRRRNGAYCKRSKSARNGLTHCDKIGRFNGSYYAMVAKLYEGFGGKMESIYWLPIGGAYDGVVIAQVPDDATAQVLDLTLRSTGHFSTIQTTPLITSEEFTAVLELSLIHI